MLSPLFVAGFSFSIENIIQPPVIGGLVLDNAQQKGVICIPKNILRNLKDQNIIGVIILNILQLKFWRLDFLLPRVGP